MGVCWYTKKTSSLILLLFMIVKWSNSQEFEKGLVLHIEELIFYKAILMPRLRDQINKGKFNIFNGNH